MLPDGAHGPPCMCICTPVHAMFIQVVMGSVMSLCVTWLSLAVLSSRQDIINVRDGSALSCLQDKLEKRSSQKQRAKSSSNTKQIVFMKFISDKTRNASESNLYCQCLTYRQNWQLCCYIMDSHNNANIQYNSRKVIQIKTQETSVIALSKI